MNTHVPGFQSLFFLDILHHFIFVKLDTSSVGIKGLKGVSGPCVEGIVPLHGVVTHLI